MPNPLEVAERRGADGERRGYEVRLMTVDQVCDYLGLSRDFVYDQVKQGRLRCSRIARQLRFRFADVESFVDLHAVVDLDTPPGPRSTTRGSYSASRDGRGVSAVR
jgi:excisionase family DNA binding protein